MQVSRAMICAIILSGVIAGSSLASTLTINVKDWQDGRDWLILKGTSIQWRHWDYNVPGVEAGHNDPTYITVKLDGVTMVDNAAWYPTWPSEYSSVWNGVTPAIPSAETPVVLSNVAARYSMSIVETPSLANGYSTIVEFNDNPIGSADWYEAQLDFTIPESVPEPSSIIALVGGLGSLLAFRRRRA